MVTEHIVEHGRVDLIVGTLFVLFHSANRFNTPATNRSSTTAGRFFLAQSVFCLAAAFTYFVLVNFPHLVTLLATGQPQDQPGYMKELSSPLVMALLMTTLLPKLPLLSNIDQWLLAQLQGMAAIPQEVRRLGAELRRQTLAVRPEVQEDVSGRMLRDGIERQDIRFEPGHDPAQLWTGVTLLLVQLESWESDRRMAGYVERYAESLRQLRERHESLTAKARACFKLLRQTGAEESEKAREAVQRYVEDFVEQVEAFRGELLDFISRGILASELTDAARGSRLAALGFTAGTGTTFQLTLNQMMSLFAVFGVLMLSSFGLSAQRHEVSQGVLLSRAIMISLIYSVAVACVVIPRQSWTIARWEPGKPRPCAFYALAGLLSVAMTQLISFGFNVGLAGGSLEAGLQRHALTFPWSLMTFATSVMTGVLIDNRPPSHLNRTRWRLMEGAMGAGTMLLAAAITHGWLLDRVDIVGTAVAESLHYRVPPIEMVLIPAAAVGFAVGYLVPSWFREAPREPAAAAGRVVLSAAA